MARTSALVGRQHERAELRQLLDEATHGVGGLVLIGGEAGIGKTALLSTALLEARQLGLPVLCGRCPGADETPPFGPWLEIAATAGSAQAPLPRPFGDGPQATAPEIASALLTLLGEGPAVLALEDLHWADPASLDLLKQIGPRLTARPVLALVTYRSDELHRSHPLWALLPELQRTGARRIVLDRLAADDVAELTALALGETQPGPAIRLYERTAGHPLFLCELLEAVSRTGAVPGEGDPLPETVQQALDSRLARLGSTAQSVLQVAAMIGERFSYDLLLQVAGRGEEEVLAALEEAVVLHVIADDHDQFTFTHALLREALLSRLIGPRRRHWHLRIAEALLVSPHPDICAIARHLYRAGDSRAASYLLEAGDQALQVGALVQAGQLYEQALETMPDGVPMRAELLLKLGFALRHGDRNRAWAYCEEALKAVAGRAVSAWARYHLLVWRPRPGDAVWHAEADKLRIHQAELLSDPDYMRLERLLCGSTARYPRIVAPIAQALMASGHLEQAAALLQQILSDLPPDADRADLLRVQWELEWYGGDRHRALALGKALMQDLIASGFYHAGITWGRRQFYLLVVCQADRPDEVDAMAEWVLQAETDVIARTGYPYRDGYSAMGYWYYLRGDWDSAYRNLVAYWRQSGGQEDHQTGKEAARLLLARGDLPGAREILSRLHPKYPDEQVADMQLGNIWVPMLQARWHLAAGAPDQARAWLEAGDRYLRRYRLDADRAAMLNAWAEFHRKTGNPDAAADAAREALTLGAEAHDCLDIIRAKRLIGLLSPAPEASVWFDEAQVLAEQCRFPYQAALVQLARGERLPTDAGALEGLSQARETFARLGALPALADSEAALEQARAATGHSLLPDGLTEREADVVRLVAQGLTDKEIGARLFISPKTVDGHLRNIFNKVGVGSRTALATYAARHGLVQ